jgi:hypothetical protein
MLQMGFNILLWCLFYRLLVLLIGVCEIVLGMFLDKGNNGFGEK